MSLDGKLIGTNTAEFMETLEEQYGDDESAKVVEVITIAVVHTDTPLGTTDEEIDAPDGYSYVHFRASEAAWHRQLGIIEAASCAIRTR